jgi:hypothetical protein
VCGEEICHSRRSVRRRRSGGNVPAGKRDENLGRDQKNESLFLATA